MVMNHAVLVETLSFWMLMLLAYVALYHVSQPLVVEGNVGRALRNVGKKIEKGVNETVDKVKDKVVDPAVEYVDELGNSFTADLLAPPINAISNSIGKFVESINNVISSVNRLSQVSTSLANTALQKLDPKAPLQTASQLDKASGGGGKLGGLDRLMGGGAAGGGGGGGKLGGIVKQVTAAEDLIKAQTKNLPMGNFNRR